VINQRLIESNEAYARQISELKKAAESMKLLETSPRSRFAYDMLFDLDRLALEHGFAESIPWTGENGKNGTDILIESEPLFRSSEPFQHQPDNLTHFRGARGIACQETACGEP
jgi:hypothetical protein